MAIYDDLDLAFEWNGDFNLGHSKDLKDTSRDGLDSLLQEIHTVAASALGDWEIYPKKGASLEDFIGEPNTRTTADQIHDRLRIAITSLGLVAEEDLHIRVIPVHMYRVLILIQVNATATENNSLAEEEGLVTQLVFDFLEQGIFFLDKPAKLLANS